MRFIAALVASAASSSSAQTIEFETDTSVVIVRTTDQFGIAVTEFIGEPGQMYQCVAMDALGKPLAVAPAMADVGQVMFQGIAASEIADVACRQL